MDDDTRLQTLEDELKLMKGQLKQTLSDVHAYLLKTDLPAPTEVVYVPGGGGGGGGGGRGGGGDGGGNDGDSARGGDFNLKGDLHLDGGGGPLPSTASTGAATARKGAMKQLEPAAPVEPKPQAQEARPPQTNQPQTGQPQIKQVEQYLLAAEPMAPRSSPGKQIESAQGKQIEKERSGEVSQATPRIHLLTNLMRWVARSKKEIGSEQLPAFLDIYSISGHLSPELREDILNLAKITPESSVDADIAETWIQSILALHGILSGGDAPLHPMKPSWNGGAGETPRHKADTDGEQPAAQPLELKLVLAGGNGKKQEYNLNLYPEKKS